MNYWIASKQCSVCLKDNVFQILDDWLIQFEYGLHIDIDDLHSFLKLEPFSLKRGEDSSNSDMLLLVLMNAFFYAFCAVKEPIFVTLMALLFFADIKNDIVTARTFWCFVFPKGDLIRNGFFLI